MLATHVAWLVGMVSTARFIISTGSDGGVRSLVSAKRTTVSADLINSGTDADYASFGVERELAALAFVAFVIMLSWWTRRRRRPNRFEMGVLLVMASGAAVQPVYASERADVMIIFVAVIAVLALNGYRISRRYTLLVGVAAILTLSALSVFRGVEVGEDGWSPIADARTASEAILVNRNFADLSKTLLIIDATGEGLESRDGSSYLSWVVAPIPRMVWASKPMIHDGPVIGTQIYGTARAGVPPGAIAESYWNLGPSGLVVVSLILGILVRWVYGVFRPWGQHVSWAGIPLYILGPLQLFQGALSVGLGAALLRLAANSLFVLVIAMSAGARPRLGSNSHAGVGAWGDL